MPNRSPNFIVVGLVIIMFVLGFFYMSCSTTTSELRRTLVNFEDRVRSLTIKTSDYERQIDLLNTSRQELREQQASLLKQAERKDADINDLNVKINEQNAALQSIKTDKQVLEEQIKALRGASESLQSKNSEMEKSHQNFNEQKNQNEQRVNELKEEIEKYKQQIDQLQHILNKPSLKTDQNVSQLLPANETQVSNKNSSLTNNSEPQFDVKPLEPPLNVALNNDTQIKVNPPIEIDLNGPNLANNTQNKSVNNQLNPVGLNKHNDEDDDAQLDNVESNKNN